MEKSGKTKNKVTVIKDSDSKHHFVENGKSLLEFARENKLDIPAPCGGNGRCGKCRIKVKGLTKNAEGKELDLLGKAHKKGYRLACYNKIEDDLEIYLAENKEDAVIMTEAQVERVVLVNCLVKKEYITLPTPSLEDQRDDVTRITSFTGRKLSGNRNWNVNVNVKGKGNANGNGNKNGNVDGNVYGNELDLIKNLPSILRKDNFNITITADDEYIYNVETGDTRKGYYGLATDIGTTTIAMYLYNLNTGNRLSVASSLNPQRVYGADVISRIDYSSKSDENRQEIQKCVVDGLNNMIDDFVSEAEISKDDIVEAVFAGNTTMMHLFAGIEPKGIALAPFIPAVTEMQNISAASIGLSINKNSRVIIFPCVSAYIGADTVAAVLSSNMHTGKEISLLIDIGTNGEIVLGCKKWMYSCSTAAGPAFEGANLRNGTGGIKGAIDKLFVREGKLSYTTIAGKKPVGICGSGIVDAIAVMLQTGVIDETGRILDADEIEKEISDDIRKRIIDIDGKNAFLIETKENSDCDTDIAVTQKDVRELQNAKAAIYAGIMTLIEKAGIKIDEVENLYIAGGFGNYLNIESALGIGLLPAELKDRVLSIGNAAGAGAEEGLLSGSALNDAMKISKDIKYIELSSDPGFVDRYVEAMMFG